MRKSIKKIIASILSLAIISTLMPVSITAEEIKQNGELNVKMTIAERSGVPVKDYFFRRGIAIEKGLLYSADNIVITENGVPITSTAEITETYEDGSIRWLLVSGKIDLRPNEFKSLTVTNGAVPKGTTTYKKDVGSITVKGKRVELKVGSKGIESLKYNGTEQLKTGSINLYATVEGETYYLNSDEFTVLKSTDTYTKLHIKGKLRKDIAGEMYITIPENSGKVQIDHFIIAEYHIPIESTGLEIGVSGGKFGEVIDSDYLEYGTMQFSSYDNTRFNGATDKAEKTGYILEPERIRFAPIVNGKPYTYWDGVSRTAHLYITFDNDAKDWAKMLSWPPNIKVDAEQYVKAGEIKSSYVSPLVDDFITTMNEAYKRGDGRFEAGVCTGYNYLTGELQIARSQPGEIEYNYGIAYMQSGNEELLRQMIDMTEFRCDVLIYRGMLKDYVGLMRPNNTYSATSGTGFFQSHGYYSDEGGLYMTYVLTGDERVLESIKLCTNFALKYMYARTGYKGNYNCEYVFLGGPDNPYKVPTKSTFTESRGLIRARSMYLFYRLFKDPKFKQAAYDIIDMAEDAQLEDGGFTQIYLNNGLLGYQGKQTQLPRKHYVNLMGLRGISQILDFEDNKKVLKIITKWSDYICNIGEKFGPTLMNPNSDPEVYRVNEDNSRATDNRANIMAVDVLITAYEHTGNERYLEWILKYLEAFIASSVGGLGGYCRDFGMGKPGKWSYEIQRNVSLFRTSDDLSKLFAENYDKIVDMGFEHLALAFTPGAVSLGEDGKGTVNYPYATRSVYELNGVKSIMMMNVVPETATEYDENWGQDVAVEFQDNRLWEGVTNVVTSPFSVTLAKWLDFKGSFHGIQRPVYIEDFSGNASVNINSYNEKEIDITFTGDYEAIVRISTGKFVIEDGIGYKVNITKNKEDLRLHITKGGMEYAKNGSLYVNFNSNGQRINSVGLSQLDTTVLKGIDANAALTENQLSSFTKELYGYDIDLSGKAPTWENFSHELVGAMSAAGGETLEKVGLYSINEMKQNPAIDDQEAVILGADALEIAYNGDSLSSDVYLTPVSLHNTRVIWKSDKEHILTSEGVLDRQAVDCDTVTLTATVTRGNAVAVRDFVIPLDRDMKSRIKGFNGYDPEINMDGLIPQKGTFEISVTGTITTSGKVESIIVLGSSEAPIEAHANFNFGVRLGWNGFIDIYDNSTYRYDVQYKVKPIRYTIRMVVRLDDMTYDVYIKPEDEEEFLIAKNYRKRSTGIPIDKVDQIWFWEGIEGAFKIEDISLLKVKKSTPADIFKVDASGKRFSTYDSTANYTYPTISDSEKFINWQVVDTKVKKNEEYVTVHLGEETIGPEKKSVFDVLQNAKLIGSAVNKDDSVTPASLVRILSLR